jgi:hypothetical protein
MFNVVNQCRCFGCFNYFTYRQKQAQHITKYADQWCPECDEGLCFDCENHHRISKSSRNHGVISIENYHTLPSSISEIGNHCEYHDMKYTLFCQQHDKPCCPDFCVVGSS